MMKLHIVDDDSFLLQSLVRNIEHYTDYKLSTSTSGRQVLRDITPPSINVKTIIIIDINLPDISGLKICQRLRQQFPYMGIIMHSACRELATVLKSFQYGADDYLTKPTPVPELIARIKALQRRIELGPYNSKVTGSQNFQIRNQTFTLEINRLIYENKSCVLTTQHSIILRELLSHTGLVQTKTLLQNLTCHSEIPHKKALITAIYRLKLFLKSHAIPLEIINHYGQGYTVIIK